jgi:hypothetical protein
MRADTVGLDLRKVAEDHPNPFGNSSRGSRYNLDRWISYSGPRETLLRTYIQVFRSGALEVTTAYDHGLAAIGSLYFNPWGIEGDILDALKRYIRLYKKHSIEPPVVVVITLLGFKGATVPQRGDRSLHDDDAYIVDRDTLLLPDIFVHDYGDALHTLMRPAFDALWQAAGVPQSFSYDETGKWSKDGYKRL